MSTVTLSKADAKRAFVSYQLRQGTLGEVFENLRSVQYDPLSPVGCNHDLVLQARIPKYRVGDWEKSAYRERAIYDGWDKQASLVPVDGWPLRRIIHRWHSGWFDRISREYPSAIEAVLSELQAKGPMVPRDFEFQEHKPEWRGSWHGPNLTKHVLRALWHNGQIMTHSRKGNHHVYDLTERVLPEQILTAQRLSDEETVEELAFERVKALGLLRPSTPFEIWGIPQFYKSKRTALEGLLKKSRVLKVDIDGTQVVTTPEFMQFLDCSPLDKATLIGPLDQLVWDRKLVRTLFDFEYLWEVYVPEAKRRWGYYVLPVLVGDDLVARGDFYCRNGVLEVRNWHWETKPVQRSKIRTALKSFMRYCGAQELGFAAHIEDKTKEALAL